MLEKLVYEPPIVAGYSLIDRQRIPIRRVALIGLVSVPVWAVIFVATVRAIGGTLSIALHVTVLGVLIAVVNLTFIMPAMHEAVHGIVARLFGARPKYGVGAGFAYTTFREPVRPVPYLAIGLAPLLAISIVGVLILCAWPFAPGQTIIFLVGNGAGAFGDLWVAMKVLQLPRECLICDLADGFAYYLPVGSSSPSSFASSSDRVDS